MTITTESIILLIAVVGNILSILISLRKVKGDSAEKIQADTEWKATVNFQLETILKSNIKLELNQQKFVEDLTKNNAQTDMNTKDIANIKDNQKRIWNKLDSLSVKQT